MKKKSLLLIFTSILILSFTGYLASCKKTEAAKNPAEPEKTFQTTSIKASSTTDIRVSAISDDPYKIVRKVEFINHATGDIMSTFYQTIISSNLTLSESLKEKVFEGTSTISDGGQNTLVIQKIGGNKVMSTTYTNSSSVKINMADPCSWSGIHQCVASKIDDMSFTEYVLCAVSAPECYGGLWVICGARC